jgi:hypothetical protein
VPAIHVDQSQITVASVSTEDTDGSHVDEEAFIIPVVIPLSAVGEWFSLYDPASSSSPLAADSRVIARAVLDALKAAAEEP